MEEFNSETMIWLQQPYESDNSRYTRIFRDYYLPQDPKYRSVSAAYKEFLVAEDGWSVEKIFQDLRSDSVRSCEDAAAGRNESQIRKAKELGINRIYTWKERAEAHDAWTAANARSLAKKTYLEFIEIEKSDYELQADTWRDAWSVLDREIKQLKASGKNISRDQVIKIDGLVRSRFNIGKQGFKAYDVEKMVLEIEEDMEDGSDSYIEVRYKNNPLKNNDG